MGSDGATSAGGSGIEALLRRDRAIVGTGLAGVTIVAWLFLVRMAAHHGGMEMAAMAGPTMREAWSPHELALTFLMWAVMMVGMMAPSAAPMLLMFATINRRRGDAGTAPVPTGVFLAGYLVVWTTFSLAAALGQSALAAAAAISASTLTAIPLVGGGLLVLAGLYELTPLKAACLSRCQSPLGFILSEWRDGLGGAFVMGIRHGAFCVGCCWALMALLFVAGVMNLVWVAAIAAFVLVEKLVPGGRLVSWTAGAVLIAWGMWVVVRNA